MSTFKDYLTESTKSYDYKIKIAGEPKDIDKNALETALQKFDLASMSAEMCRRNTVSSQSL